VVRIPAEAQGVEVRAVAEPDENAFAALYQNLDEDGEVHDYAGISQKFKAAGNYNVAIVDLLSLTSLTAPVLPTIRCNASGIWWPAFANEK